jgi:hypothetical protein
MFNYTCFIANKGVDELVQLAQGERECHKKSDFINPEHGHIATCDVKVKGHTQLQALFSMGTKHRWWSKKWEMKRILILEFAQFSLVLSLVIRLEEIIITFVSELVFILCFYGYKYTHMTYECLYDVIF